ncbi:hypothetical protein OK074_8135 [Actinobacteria bacterium OK074]|nr:hypothetical protein OK074_8135 [Actinobacteria bacterium OK074]
MDALLLGRVWHEGFPVHILDAHRHVYVLYL